MKKIILASICCIVLVTVSSFVGSLIHDIKIRGIVISLIMFTGIYLIKKLIVNKK